MLRIASVLLLGFLLGGLLASGTISALPCPAPGALGLLVMLIIAWAARGRWSRAAEAPGSPERTLWLKLGSLALVVGNLVTGLWRMGPTLQLHTHAANAWAINNWILIVGAFIAYAIARDPEPRKDERDVQIAATGKRVFHGAILGQLVMLALVLGYDIGHITRAFSRAMLAELLIVAMAFSSLADAATRLHAYWRERNAEAREP
jgi:hypothetical protein